MYLVQILLPLRDNEGQHFGRRMFRTVAEELAKRFGGLTAHTRAPAEGLWKDGAAETDRDEIVIYEVMAEALDEHWWRKYRARLEKRFRQDEVVIRVQKISLI